MKSFGDPDGKLPERDVICSVTERVFKVPRRHDWMAWMFSGMGFFSLLWFLVRVIPKPSRAAYPCQRAAFPIASGFVVWVLALLGSAFAWRKSRSYSAKVWKAGLWFAAAVSLAAMVVVNLPSTRSLASGTPNAPIGVARGVFPGRVAWVYAPTVANWDGYTSTEHWYASNHTDLAVVTNMLSKVVRSVGGGNSDAAAWDAIFRYYNTNHNRGDRGYQAGEKIAIKLNLTTCNGRSGTSTVDINGTYEKQNSYNPGDGGGANHWLNSIDNSPQVTLSLLRHLVYTVGVNQTNIYLGDTTGNFPKYQWDYLHPEFPNVHYFDNYGGQGRMRTELSATPFYWSTNSGTTGKVQDYVPVPFAVADYIINFPVMKVHSQGITVCGKNWFGAMLRCPDGYFRDAGGSNVSGTLNYVSMHALGPDPGQSGTPGTNHYRVNVDLMSSPVLGGKVVLNLVDGLFAAQNWNAHPYKWSMAPFSNNWPCSLFASQDPVAIDSVCYDFLSTEWPGIADSSGLQGGAQDYLHEAALASNPPSGTFYDPGRTGMRIASQGVHEHWNNSTSRQYSRNLGTGQGIELVALTATSSSDAVQSLTLQVTNSLRVGATAQATVWANYAAATNNVTADPDIAFSSSNPGVFTVSAGGLLTGAGAGTATLTATYGGQSASNSITVSLSTPTQLAFTQQPSSVSSNNAIAPAVTVQLRDASGNNVASNGVTISITLASGAVTLSGTTSATTDGNGLATFSNLVMRGQGVATLQASSAGLTSSTSQSFAIFDGPTIPTVSEWGLIIMGLLLLVVGVKFLPEREFARVRAGNRR